MRRLRLVLVAAVALGALAACGDDDTAEGPAVRPADEGIEGVLAIRIAPYRHTEEDVDFDRSPSAGGPHGSFTASCRFLDQPVPEEHLVHSMEHGAVWIAYSASLSAEELAVIEQVVLAHDDTVASPYPGLDDGVPLVVTAWGRQLQLDSVDDPRLVEFVEKYRRSENAPERNIGCPPS